MAGEEKKTKYAVIRSKYLPDPDVTRWYENLKSGSPRTAENYLFWLGDYCIYRRKTPRELIGEFKKSKKRAQDGIEDYIGELKRRPGRDGKPFKPKTINIALTAVKSWFRRNELPITREINVGNVRYAPTIEKEHIPSQEELRRIFDLCDVRERTIIALLAFAGIRPEAISRLSIGDLPELEMREGTVAAKKEPMRVNIRAEISKNKRPYFVFLIKEGADYLSAYLQSRLYDGEKLTPASPVVSVAKTTMSRGQLKSKGQFVLSKGALMKPVRDVMRRSNTSISGFRPYVLRSYFDSRLQSAKVPHIWEQFWMGHTGEIEAQYSVRKNLTEEQVSEMRKVFKDQAERYLSTIRSASEDSEVSTLRAMVETGVLDFDNERVRAYLATKLGIPVGHPDIVRMLREKLEIQHMEILEEEKPDPKIITESELQKYLDDGWDIQTVLPSGKVVVKK
jgi:integrase